jgi:hypothetical protein
MTYLGDACLRAVGRRHPREDAAILFLLISLVELPSDTGAKIHTQLWPAP